MDTHRCCDRLEGRESSPAAIGRSAHMPSTRGKQLEESTGEHLCPIVTMMQFASSSSQLCINRACMVERESTEIDTSCFHASVLSLSLSLSVSGDY